MNKIIYLSILLAISMVEYSGIRATTKYPEQGERLLKLEEIEDILVKSEAVSSRSVELASPSQLVLDSPRLRSNKNDGDRLKIRSGFLKSSDEQDDLYSVLSDIKEDDGASITYSREVEDLNKDYTTDE